MSQRYIFDGDVLHSVAGGRSAIDSPRLNVRTSEEAQAFISCYGFDLARAGEEDRLWYFHRRALVLLTERLGYQESEIPEPLRSRQNLGSIEKLLLFASSRNPDDRELQRWSCAILRSMHVFVHAESDMFSFFSEEIQAQILGPIQNSIVHEAHQTYLRQSSAGTQVELRGFEVKPFKTSQSTVIKLLAKPDALAMKVFDKLGVRFITKNLFDAFQVIRFLVEESLISYPHIMPDQSSNNLYPVDLFVEICRELEASGRPISNDELEGLFERRLQGTGANGFFRKHNEQSDENFRFIKFITRRLIHITPLGGKAPFSFFYPFEVQILDEASHVSMKSGPSEHEAYKDRQKQAARRRLFTEEEKQQP